jgi:hypothetical protein
MVSINTETDFSFCRYAASVFLKLLMLNRELEGIQLQTQPNQQLLKLVLP